MVVFDMIVDGKTMREIGEHFGRSRGLIYTWIKNGGEDRQAAFKEARRISADLAIEDASEKMEELLDPEKNPLLSPAQVSAVKSYANFKQWVASKYDRETYGDTPQTQVNVFANGDLMLSALQQHGSVHTLPESGGDTPRLGQQRQLAPADG